MEIFKTQDGGWPPFWNPFFDHNTAANCPISVKYCTGKQNSVVIEIM